MEREAVAAEEMATGAMVRVVRGWWRGRCMAVVARAEGEKAVEATVVVGGGEARRAAGRRGGRWWRGR